MASYAPVCCPFTASTMQSDRDKVQLFTMLAVRQYGDLDDVSAYLLYLRKKKSKMYCIYPKISQPTNGKCFISEGGEGRGESRSRCACISYCFKLMTGCLSYS